MSGFMGLVELGSMTGSQFAAGKSYQDAVTSPCIVGIMNGASLEDLVARAPSVDASGLEAESGASWMTLRSF